MGKEVKSSNLDPYIGYVDEIYVAAIRCFTQ